MAQQRPHLLLAFASSTGGNHWRRRRLVWLLLLLVGCVALGGVNKAYAHAIVVRSEPTDMAIYPEAPGQGHIWFSEPIAGRFSAMRLLDSNGQPVAIGLITSNTTDQQLSFALPSLPPGTYSLFWRVLSEADGHFSQGMVIFGIGESVDLSATPSFAAVTTPPWPEILLRWLNLIAVSAVVGAVAMITLVVLPAHQAVYTTDPAPHWDALHQRLHGWLLWCSGAALLIGLGLLLWQGITLRTETTAATPFADAVGLLLGQTRWGNLWLVRQGLLLLLCWLVWRQSRQPIGTAAVRQHWRLALLGLLSLALLTVQVLTGHAAGDRAQMALTVVMAMVHAAAASLWVGGLIALTFGLWPWLRQGQTALLQACWRRFSLPAFSSLLLLSATGLYNLARQVASLDALITTTYGRVLLGKGLLVLLMSLLGLAHARQLHPALLDLISIRLQHLWSRRPASFGGMPRFIAPEIGVGIGILLATALVTATPPPRGIEFTLAPDAIPSALSQTVDDLVVTLAIKPNRPGQNVFTVRSVSSRRPAPAPILRVLLRFTPLEQPLDPITATAVEVEPGHYLVTGAYLKVAGSWQIDVVTRRSGLEDRVARFTWLVAPPGALSPVILSKQPWAGSLTLASAGLLLIALLVVMLIQQQMSRR